MRPPSGAPMMTHPVRACGRVSSVKPNARRWLMAAIPAATSGSRCSRRFAGGWRRRLGGADCCWCLMICSGRTRRRRSCSQMSCASCEGRSSWCWRPTGSRRPPVIRAPGCCRVCRRMPTPNGWTFLAWPPARSGICCSPPGCRHRQTRPVRCTPKRGATRSWSASWPACSPSSGAAGRCRDGWRRRRPTGSRSCRIPPGRWRGPPPWQATTSRLAWWPGSWKYVCLPCSARWTSAGPPGSWWPGTVPVITGSRTRWSARRWPPG